jgi:hypothetical protein
MSETIDITNIDVTESSKKRLRSELFAKELFEEKVLPPEHKFSSTHREVRCLNCSYVFFYIFLKRKQYIM